MRTISNFINGQSVTCSGSVSSSVYDPSTRQVQARLEHCDATVLAEAVASAKAAQPACACACGRVATLNVMTVSIAHELSQPFPEF